MPEVLFIVQRQTDEDGGHWAYINSCPHGSDLGAIHLGPVAKDERSASNPHWDAITWQFQDIGNGRCMISPSILAKGVHNGEDCHFGPGEFNFVWLEKGQLRDRETGLPSNEYMKDEYMKD
jgi:hypothetical protein